jgi:hypothetical protein
MWDWDDANEATDDAIFFGPGGWIGLILVILVAGIGYYVASSNDKECSQIACPDGQKAQLLQHECKCVQSAPRQP